MIDYRELLKKYIEHVGCEEGTTFISNTHYDPTFSQEEREALAELSIEAGEGDPFQWIKDRDAKLRALELNATQEMETQFKN